MVRRVNGKKNRNLKVTVIGDWWKHIRYVEQKALGDLVFCVFLQFFSILFFGEWMMDIHVVACLSDCKITVRSLLLDAHPFFVCTHGV